MILLSLTVSCMSFLFSIYSRWEHTFNVNYTPQGDINSNPNPNLKDNPNSLNTDIRHQKLELR